MELLVAQGIMTTRKNSGAFDEAEQPASSASASAGTDSRPASGAAAESRPASSGSMMERDSAQSETGEPSLFANLARSITPPPDAEPSLFESLKSLVSGRGESPPHDATRGSVRFRVTV